jgi:radical SAM protein (TIGR01212 family)
VDTRDYFRLGEFLRARFGERVHKVALDAGLTCPNRDGTKGTGGCIYCNPRGSGTGAWSRGLSIAGQIDASRERLTRRFKAKKFIAYFQSFSNTYAPLGVLEGLWREALSPRDVVGLAVGTRPDCIDGDVLGLLKDVAGERLVWLELGLQSASDETLKLINRGHTVAEFEGACLLAREFGIPVVAHVILGLPGETLEDTRRTAKLLSRLGLFGVKIHLLYIIRGSALADMYERGGYAPLTREAYAEMAADFLGRLDPKMVIHRVTGDPHPEELLAPRWALEKRKNLDALRRAMAERNIVQGSLLDQGAGS